MPSRLLDTPAGYGLVSRLLHWSMAILILWQLAGMALKLILGRHPVSGFFVGTHQSVGLVIFLLVLLRILWALAMRQRRPPHGPGLLGLAARLGHGALYLLMALIPALGLLRQVGGTRGLTVFGTQLVPPREDEIGWMVRLADMLHGELGWILAVLVGGHVAMVALHEALWRDRTLSRMAGRLPAE